VTTALLADKNAELRHERDVAEGRLDLALGAIGQFRKAVAENVDVRNRPDLASLRKDLLKAPLEFYRQLRQDVERGGGSRPDAPARLAQALSGLALITAEIDSQPQAIRALREAIGVLEPLDRDRPSPHRADLAQSCYELAALLLYAGRMDEARASFERARGLWAAMARDRPADPTWQAEVASADNALGVLHWSVGRHAEARTRLEQALAIRAALTRDHPDMVAYRAGLAATHVNVGLLEIDEGRGADARVEMEKARDLQEALVRDRPEVPAYGSALAYNCTHLGDLLVSLGRGDEARACYERAREVYESLAREHPTVTNHRAGLAWSVAALGYMLQAGGRADEAREPLARSIELRESLVRENPDVELHRHGLAWSYRRLAEVHLRTHRPAEALSCAERARGHSERLVRGNPGNLEYRNSLGWVLRYLGTALLESGRGPEALAAFHEAVEHQRLAFAGAPGRFRDDLEDHYLALLVAQRKLGRHAEAAALSREARGALEGDKDAGSARGIAAEHLVFLACLDAMEGEPLGQDPAGSSADEPARHRATERALGRLRQAVEGGYRDVARLGTEPALDSLRPMAGFQELLRDASFPANPFHR
jgi:tetratricopeptide (TPR) repeat protein